MEIKMGKKVSRAYEPPVAVDLTAFSVLGQDKDPKPAGMCLPGGQLTFTYCTPVGTLPAGGECSPTGISPQYGYCRIGNVAVEGCLSGGAHA